MLVLKYNFKNPFICDLSNCVALFFLDDYAVCINLCTLLGMQSWKMASFKYEYSNSVVFKKYLHIIFCKEQAGVWIKSHPRPCCMLASSSFIFFVPTLQSIGYLWTTIYFHFYTTLNDKWDGRRGKRKLGKKTEGQVRL